MKAVWMFPGQGSQYPGMGRELCDRYPPARDIFEEAEALSGLPLREISFAGPDNRLRQCDVLEPALTAIALGHAARLREYGLEPSCVAGYSAGEIAALCCAGVLTRTDALKAAAIRGRILNEATSTYATRMVALYRLDAATVEALVAEVSQEGNVAIGAWNASENLTIVGQATAVAEVERRAVALGADLSMIDVAGPWHCTLARKVADEVAQRWREIPFAAPRLPLYSSATGQLETEPERLRQALVEQIWKPVLWQQIMADLFQHGTRHFLEVGAGRFLHSLVKRSGRHSAKYSVGFVERENGRTVSVAKILAILGPS